MLGLEGYRRRADVIVASIYVNPIQANARRHVHGQNESVQLSAGGSCADRTCSAVRASCLRYGISSCFARAQASCLSCYVRWPHPSTDKIR